MDDRIAELIDHIERTESPSRDDTRALVSEVLAFHGEGLRRLIELLDKTNPTFVKETAAKDPLIASLLDLHDLQHVAPPPPAPELLPASSLLRKSLLHRSRKAKEEASCELCGATVEGSHPHLVELAGGIVRCSCRACALLFDSADETRAGQRYRRVPDDVRRAPTLAADDVWWGSLGLPIGVAFLTRIEGGEGGAAGGLARYPGPAGATEATIPDVVWTAIANEHPILSTLVPEVQAVLVNRSEGAREHWILGIDRCYELVGRIRETWRGLTGGDGVRAELREFFAQLASEAEVGAGGASL